MDTIKLEIYNIRPYLQSKASVYNVKVLLNDVEVCPTHCFGGLGVVVASRYRFAEFYLFTCSCGVPGCAGFHEEVVQKRVDNTIIWTFPSEDYYKTKKFVYAFDKKQFDEEFANLYAEMVRLERENIHHETVLEGRYDDYDDDEPNQDEYSIQKIEEFEKWYVNNYQAIQDFMDVLAVNAPDLINKSFVWFYNGKRGKYSTDLYRLICNAFNQYPRDVEQAFFLAKVRLGIRAVRHYLDGDNTLYMKILFHNHKRFGEPVLGSAEWNFYDETEQPDFDIRKMVLAIEGH